MAKLHQNGQNLLARLHGNQILILKFWHLFSSFCIKGHIWCKFHQNMRHAVSKLLWCLGRVALKCWQSSVVTLTIDLLTPKCIGTFPLQPSIYVWNMKAVRWTLLKWSCQNQSVDKVPLWLWPFDPKMFRYRPLTILHLCMKYESCTFTLDTRPTSNQFLWLGRVWSGKKVPALRMLNPIYYEIIFLDDRYLSYCLFFKNDWKPLNKRPKGLQSCTWIPKFGMERMLILIGP